MAVPFVQAIQIARAAGGLTSWAHPVPYHIDRYLETFIAAGLQGVEGLRPSLNSRDRNRFKKLARKHGLFLTGGSDFHGWAGEELGLYQLTTQQLGPFFDAIRAA
jgi:predicted metal-dependent phosphoesterase TrpH